MPGGNQPTGGWVKRLRRARVVRLTVSALAAVAPALLIATPAPAQPLVPDPAVADPAPIVTIAQGLLASVTTTVEGVTAPVTESLPADVLETLNGVVSVDPPARPVDALASVATPPAPTVAPASPARDRAVTTGPAAVLSLARSATSLLIIALAAALFLSFEAVLSRRDPRLTRAPVDRREAELEFR